MEIISYVQDKPRTRINRVNIQALQPKIRKREKTASVTYSLYSPELRSFTPQKVRPPVSAKSFFRIVGGSLTLTGDFLKENYRKILGSMLICAALVTASIGAYRFVNSRLNYTGPLTLETGESQDIENLNKLMASFALDGGLDVDESGKLLDAEVNINKLFTTPVSFQSYKVCSGDTISGIAKKFGLTNISTLISVNDIGNVRQLAAGQRLKIPSIDGIVYTVKAGDSINSIVKKYDVRLESVLDVNELTSDVLTAGQQLFLPGVGLDSGTLKSAMGDMFRMPIAAKFRWSSPYGSRIDPIAGVKSFHTGTDMACPTGTPILASMSGKVTAAGVNRVYGNYVIIDHGNGYQTLYAHMSKIIATKGQWVSQGTRIGLVGSTGYSTGPHLHFTVYKNGKLINPMSVLK